MANQNPAVMSDEELDAAIEAGGVDPAPAPEVEEPETPETPPEEEEPEAPEEEQPENPEPPEEVEEPAPEPSRREQKRVADLLKKYPDLAQDPESASKLKTPENLLDYDKDLDADDALRERLKADREAATKAAYDQGLSSGAQQVAQERANIMFHTRLEIDAPVVAAKYPILDKNSSKFNQNLANDINTLYLQSAQYNDKTGHAGNPDVRYEPFVEAFFTAAKEAAEDMVATSQKNVVKRAAKTGIRPDGSSPKKTLDLSKQPWQMTDEELDAAIAQGLPS